MSNGMTFRVYCDKLDTSLKLIDAGYIDDISHTFTATISQTAVMSLPSTKAIDIDSGVGEKLNFTYNRICPREPNDESDDSIEWSNGFWAINMFDRVVDRWQGETDGSLISLTMDSDVEELYPSFSNRRCYISKFSFGYKAGDPQTISGEIEFTIGSFKLAKNTENSIIYRSNFAEVSSALTDVDTCMVSLSPETTAIDYPATWYNYAKTSIPDKLKIWWCTNLTDTYVEATTADPKRGWNQGDNITLGSDTMTVYARYYR